MSFTAWSGRGRVAARVDLDGGRGCGASLAPDENNERGELMIIVWRGWGVVVLLIALAAIFLAVGLVQGTGAQNPAIVGLIYVASSALAALAIWLLVNHLEGGEAQVFVEKSTGREVQVKGDAGSLFFVPTRY